MHTSICCLIVLGALASCTTPSSALLPRSGYVDTDARAGTEHAAARTAAMVPQDRKTDLKAGDVELIIAATGINDEDFEVGSAALGLLGGFYVNDDGLAVILRQSLNFADSGPGTDTWNGASRVGIQQTFETGAQLMPFIGLTVGRVYGDTVDETWTAGPEAGIKWYLKQEAFLQLSAEYQFFFDENDAVGELAEDGNFIYLLGFGLKF